MNSIPPITHPLGKYWDQPNRAEIEIDVTHALMTQSTLSKLGEYSATIPSGVYEGKMWRARFRGSWFLRWFDVSNIPNNCSIQTREILIV